MVHRHVDEGKCVSAGGALEVFPLEDGDLGTGRRNEHGGVAEVRSLAGGKGGLRGRGDTGEREEQRGGEES